ncbi:MAG: Asp-tRNA(Asn)/Glu-tRNA(Gln) amidotransferase subunit GatA [bacterium]|nr:Asp-tRNA(Asn)/Glu-tRNA(Gln) amidotransferase subunit GatA [bacterium]MDE0242881.1 Asp-tRNA(Asn)/Glu-tRNA(Gln) amidotransferase subunit GatA [bacterium]
MTALTDLTIAGARDLLAAGDVSAVELARAHLAAMERHRDLNAFITETPERALELADASDRRRRNGDAGRLEGIPVAIKDLFCTKGVPTTAGSRILDGFRPFYESTVTASMLREGAVMLGKTNLDEFAMGSSNLTSWYGPAINPWRAPGDGRVRVPGGSSGGSASAVAARMAMAATGTDTGGSIRQPAAFTGTVGLKPTYGRCSRLGIVAFASSLDQAGPLTRTVRDAAIMLGAMAGHDPLDSTSADEPLDDLEDTLEAGVDGMTIGVPEEYRVEGMPEVIDELWQRGIAWLEDAGATVREVSLPHTRFALPAYYIIAPAEASSNLARYDGVRYGLRCEGDDLVSMYERTRAEGFGAEVKRRILIGTYVLSEGYFDAYYLKAQKVRTRIADDFREAWTSVDALLTPTTPSAAFAADSPPDDPVSMYLNDVFTVPASLAGLPGISVPAGLDGDGLPLGLQVIARPFDEARLLRVARTIEEAAGFDTAPRSQT